MINGESGARNKCIAHSDLLSLSLSLSLSLWRLFARKWRPKCLNDADQSAFARRVLSAYISSLTGAIMHRSDDN